MIGSLVEGDRKFIFAGNDVNAVSAGRELLAIDEHIVRNRDFGCFVRATAPHVTVWFERKVFASTRSAVNGSLALSSRGRDGVCFDQRGNFVRRNVSPNDAAFDCRTMISDRHISNADSLRDGRRRAVLW